MAQSEFQNIKATDISIKDSLSVGKTTINSNGINTSSMTCNNLSCKTLYTDKAEIHIERRCQQFNFDKCTMSEDKSTEENFYTSDTCEDILCSFFGTPIQNDILHAMCSGAISFCKSGSNQRYVIPIQFLIIKSSSGYQLSDMLATVEVSSILYWKQYNIGLTLCRCNEVDKEKCIMIKMTCDTSNSDDKLSCKRLAGANAFEEWYRPILYVYDVTVLA